VKSIEPTLPTEPINAPNAEFPIGFWSLTTDIRGAEHSDNSGYWIGKIRGHYTLNTQADESSTRFGKVGDSRRPGGLYSKPFSGDVRWETYLLSDGSRVWETNASSRNESNSLFAIRLVLTLHNGRLAGVWSHLGEDWSKNGLWGVIDGRIDHTNFLTQVVDVHQPCWVRCFAEQGHPSLEDFERAARKVESEPRYASCRQRCL
jgi:hypothetical protein